VAQKRETGLRPGKLGLCPGNVFRARSRLSQLQRGAQLRDAGTSGFGLCPGLIQGLHTGGAAGLKTDRAIKALLGQYGGRFGRGQLRPHLCDFLRPGAVAQLEQGLPHGFHLRLCLSGLQLQRAGVQHGDDLPGLDAVAFLDVQLGNSTAAVEGERDLPDVHIALQHQFAGVARGAMVPPVPSPGGGGSDHDKGDKETFHSDGLSGVCASGD